MTKEELGMRYTTASELNSSKMRSRTSGLWSSLKVLMCGIAGLITHAASSGPTRSSLRARGLRLRA